MSRKPTRLVAAASLTAMSGVLALWAWLARPQQSSVRLTSKLELKRLRTALDSYRDTFGGVPDNLEALASAGKSADLSRFSEFQYVAGLEGVLAFQRKPFRRLAAGEPWGGRGQVARHDIPAARLVLLADGTIEFVEESEFKRKYLALLRSRESR